MLLKQYTAVLLTGILLIVGACSRPSTPTTQTPPTTPPAGGSIVTPTQNNTTVPPAGPVGAPTQNNTPPPTPNLTQNTTPGGTPTPPPPEVQGPNEVWTAANSFVPGILTVPVGTTVVWKNKDSQVHTVVSNTGLFYGTLEVGGSFNYTFTKPGDYEYNCDIHPGMTGAIHVQ